MCGTGQAMSYSNASLYDYFYTFCVINNYMYLCSRFGNYVRKDSMYDFGILLYRGDPLVRRHTRDDLEIAEERCFGAEA